MSSVPKNRSFVNDDGQTALPLGLPLDRAETNARSLLMLMGGTVRGVIQHDGGYAGPRPALSVEDLTKHFAGDHAVAIQGVTGTGRNATSRFFAWDIDERATERIPILAKILASHGLLEHAITTGGSDAGRGKVIVFTNPIPADHAADLAFAILTQARKESGWGIEVHASESRPTAKTGGLLRISGRNPKRFGPFEEIFRLETGFPVSLSQIGRAPYEVPLEPRVVAKPRVAPYVQKMLANGLPWPSDGSKGVLKVLTRMAVFCVRSGYGKASYDTWAAAIHAKSPWLDAPTQKNKDVRGVRWDRVSKAGWSAGSKSEKTSRNTYLKKANPILHLPKGEESTKYDVISHLIYVPKQYGKTQERLDRVENALHDLFRIRDLHPDAFSISYLELGDVVGMKPQTVFRFVRLLVAHGRIVIVDRGTQGVNGLKTIYALPQGRSLEAVMQAAAIRPVMKLRMTKRAEYAELLAGRLVDLDEHRTKYGAQTSATLSDSELQEIEAEVLAFDRSHKSNPRNLRPRKRRNGSFVTQRRGSMDS